MTLAQQLLGSVTPCVMGVINCSPNSFYGAVDDNDQALTLAAQMVAEGASIIDVGGEATNPKVDLQVDGPSLQQEIDRVVPVIEAIKHAAGSVNSKAILTWIDSTDFEESPEKLSELKRYNGIIIPGGFGSRGIEGKIAVIRFCRENNIPYFGLCYGMQLMIIEYARNVLGMEGAHTTEVNSKTPYPVIDIMPEQKENMRKKNYGATMRLGQYEAKLVPDTLAYQAYGRDKITERHRHRYEVNPQYVNDIKESGLVFSASSPNGVLMEIAELPRKQHSFFLATQFHPEFQSSLLFPHPLFVAFLKACKEKR